MSDFNAIDIKSRRRRGKKHIEACYTCGCGGQLFLLLPSGAVVCSGCECINTPLEVGWVGGTPAHDATPPEGFCA